MRNKIFNITNRKKCYQRRGYKRNLNNKRFTTDMQSKFHREIHYLGAIYLGELKKSPTHEIVTNLC